MKTTFTSLFLVLGFIAKSQTFLPATTDPEVSNTFRYDFGAVRTSHIKDIKFTITGFPNGTTFDLMLEEPEFTIYNQDGYCDNKTTTKNYSLPEGTTGTITGGKGNFTVSFNPQQYYMTYGVFDRFEDPWTGQIIEQFQYCDEKEYNEMEERNASLVVTMNTSVQNQYYVNLKGKSSLIITALDSKKIAVKTETVPNPVKDFIDLKQESIVTDLSGKQVLAGKGIISVNHLTKGIYILRTGNQIQKLVKE